MIKRKRSINSIIHDQLLGYASEEDKKQLQSWLDSSQENRENYDRLMREACLIDRYKQFAQVDEERAWERFQKKHFSIRSARWVKIGRYAAIFLLPIIGFAIWFWTLRLMDSQPVISDEVRIAMIRSEKMGKQKATLVLANGQKMDLKSVPAKPLQDSVEQVPVAQPSVPKTDMNESEEVSVVENNKLSTYDDVKRRRIVEGTEECVPERMTSVLRISSSPCRQVLQRFWSPVFPSGASGKSVLY